MLKSKILKIGLAVFVLSAFMFGGVEEELKKINQKLDNINTRLQSLEKKVAAAPAKKTNNKKQSDPNAVYNIPVSNSVVLGNPNAKVTITEWTDFQWPYCAKSVSLVDDILEKYPNDVKVVIKNFPLSFHKQALKAAKYSLAAHKQGKYKEMYYLIMENYGKLKTNEDLPLEYAKQLNLDLNKFIADMESEEVSKQIDLEMKQLRESGIPRLSVPKFLIQGKEPQGRSLEVFSSIIDTELAKLK